MSQQRQSREPQPCVRTYVLYMHAKVIFVIRAAITLTHRAQVKRFTSDILKVLKSQSAKQVRRVILAWKCFFFQLGTLYFNIFQVSLMDLPIIYEKVTTRPFRITDYGVREEHNFESSVFKILILFLPSYFKSIVFVGV